MNALILSVALLAPADCGCSDAGVCGCEGCSCAARLKLPPGLPGNRSVKVDVPHVSVDVREGGVGVEAPFVSVAVRHKIGGRVKNAASSVRVRVGVGKGRIKALLDRIRNR